MTDAGAPPPVTARPRRRRLAIGVGATLAVLVGVGLLPARNWQSQQDEIRDTRAALGALRDANVQLEAKIARMSSDDAIERQAREEFGLVYPGEEPYTVLAPPAPTVALPDVWPFDVLQDPLARAAARAGATTEGADGGITDG